MEAAEWSSWLAAERRRIVAENRKFLRSQGCACMHEGMRRLNALYKAESKQGEALLGLTIKRPQEKSRLCWFPRSSGSVGPFPRASFPRRCARLKRAEPLPQSISFIQLRTSVRSEDDPVLRFAPYFGDGVEGREVLANYDVRAREAAIQVACPALALQMRPPQPEEVEAPPRPAKRNKTYADDADSYRKLFCRRCFVYDCNLHGNLGCAPVGPPRERAVVFAPSEAAPAKISSFEPMDENSKRVAAHAVRVFGGCSALAARALRVDADELRDFLGMKGVWRCCARCGGGDRPIRPPKKRRRTRHPDRKFGAREIEVGAAPCRHEGPCTLANCECLQKDVFCSKYCGCSLECDRRSCPCFAAGRECDPDLCGGCGAAAEGGGNCSNNQLGAGKPACKLAIARSTIPGAGWGLFAPRGARKNQLIAEYVGERISQEEAERRGRVYDKLNRSYLFNANDEEVVDATRYGNKSRFANHSDRPNCSARTKLVDGTTRVAIYANTEIPPHAELFFDYRYAIQAETQSQRKHAVMVDWMRDAAMANVVSASRGATLLPSKKHHQQHNRLMRGGGS
ncbi:hypothetical protein CTAYLR_002610 [Chrysophaeum taylorii]|uniref:Uncharacterized protein n=1 Tax=Chrysophaeum taylorii TaxID=2483200 RepID=A0AAD7XLP1_9STRA|nr:hypothetical protein CTAYLR_002610 [Chrysophaeum taylorii]